MQGMGSKCLLCWRMQSWEQQKISTAQIEHHWRVFGKRQDQDKWYLVAGSSRFNLQSLEANFKSTIHFEWGFKTLQGSVSRLQMSGGEGRKHKADLVPWPFMGKMCVTAVWSAKGCCCASSSQAPNQGLVPQLPAQGSLMCLPTG
jgi:hypothetical protein